MSNLKKTLKGLCVLIVVAMLTSTCFAVMDAYNKDEKLINAFKALKDLDDDQKLEVTVCMLMQSYAKNYDDDENIRPLAKNSILDPYTEGFESGRWYAKSGKLALFTKPWIKFQRSLYKNDLIRYERGFEKGYKEASKKALPPDFWANF